MSERDAKLAVLTALRDGARALRSRSSDPRIVIEAAQHEARFDDELAELTKRGRGRPRKTKGAS